MTRTATVLVTDIVDSTGARARLGDTGADALFAEHDRIVAECIEETKGEVVKRTGDGVLAVFPGASDALVAAVRIQQQLRRMHGAEPLDVRVGLAAGDVAFDGGDVSGTPVVEATRLCGAARGGQILTSALVRGLAGTRADVELRPVGDLELKGLPEPVSTYEVGWEVLIDEAVPLPAALAVPAAFPFAGRFEEQEALLTAWKRAATGDRRLVLLAGEPGVGKTRLCAEVARRVIDDGGLVLAGRCDEELGMPYQPFVEALVHYVNHRPDSTLGATPVELAHLHPPLAARVGQTPVQGVDPETERYRLFGAVVSWLSEASADAPVMLVLDDLHWAAKPTLLMLRHLLRASDPMHLLLVTTYRDTDLDRTHPLSEMLADLRRAPGVERLAVRGLDLPGVVSFLEGAAGHSLDDPRGLALAEAIHDETEGNAFFVEEIIRHLVETEQLVFRDGRWTSDVEHVEDLGIPEGIRDVVGRRLSRLSHECNGVLGRAAVVGREWDVATVAAMGDGVDEVLAAVDEALPAGLLTEVGGPEATYAFSHALVRQTLYEELSVARRQRWHLAAADAVEHVHGWERAAAVAAHLREAGTAADPERAVNASLLAAELARQRLAWEDAASHWAAAIEMLDDRGGDPRRTAQLLEQIGDAMYASAIDWHEGIEQLERARVTYDDLGEERSAAKVRSRIGRNLVTFPERLDLERGFTNLDAACDVLRRDGDSAALAYALIGIATGCSWNLDVERGLATAREALEIAERLGNRKVIANARALLAPQVFGTGRAEEGRELVERAYAEAVDLGEPLLAWIATFSRTGWSRQVGDPADGLAWTERELASGRHDGAPALRLTLMDIAAAFRFLMGRPPDEGDDIPRLAVRSAFSAGRFAEAERAAEEMTEDYLRSGNVLNALGTLDVLASVHVQTHDLAKAREVTLKLLALLPTPTWPLAGMRAFAARARVLGLAGKRADGAAAVAEARLFPASGDLRGLGGRLEWGDALSTEDDAKADRLFASAVETLEQYQLMWEAAEACEDWGWRTGRVEPLDRALAIYEGIGAGGQWGERARRIRAGITST